MQVLQSMCALLSQSVLDNFHTIMCVHTVKMKKATPALLLWEHNKLYLLHVYFEYSIERDWWMKKCIRYLLWVPRWTGGGCLMVVLAIFIHSWRILTFTISLITCLTFLIFPFIPNSPQWLLVNDKKDEAYKVLESIAKANRRELPDRDSIQVPGVQTVNQSILDILKHSKLRTWVLVNILTWYVPHSFLPTLS